MTTPSAGSPAGTFAWRDVTRSPGERAADLASRLTLEEKVSQLAGLWVGADPSGGGVAPYQADMTAGVPPWAEAIRHGLGQITRAYGTAPVEPAAGARSLAASQRQVMESSRFGIPAQVHEECLAGFAAFRATAYPVPLAWGASFDPELVELMARQIGEAMHAAGVHQGLAPVLDVTRDYRWGRVEETIGEDPYLVGTTGAAYVRGLESAGVVATLKHFAGYSASRAGRNLAPVSMGARDLGDVILPPFEMALRHGQPRAIMHSYTSLDRVPSAADEALLTGLLRDTWGFEGIVVADYFGVRFLETLHRVAGDAAEAAHLALRAGVDVELPTVDAYGPALLTAVREGQVPESLVDRALLRVLTQKAELGLLDADWTPEIADPEALTFDTEASRDIALRLARESVVLLSNDGSLPLAAHTRVALVGPLADEATGMLGCYSFPVHVGSKHPEHGMGIDIPTVLEALGETSLAVSHARGVDVTAPDVSGIAEAVELARGADVAIVAVGDRAGLFGRGTSGEGCDAADLTLPGRQHELVTSILDTGTPVVLLLIAGRPYALGAYADRAAAIVQTFFPGQLGGRAIAELLTGAVSPSGHLPVCIPRLADGQPSTYLSAPLGRKTDVSNIDPTPLYPFGHGLSYTTFEWSDVRVVSAQPHSERPRDDGHDGDGLESGGDEGVVAWPVDGEVRVELTVRNTGDRPGADVVQLYLHDQVAQVTRPVVSLVGYARVELEPGAASELSFTVPADVTSFIGLSGRRIVEPGAVELRVSHSSAEVHTSLPLRLVGAEREIGHTRRLLTSTEVRPVAGDAARDDAITQGAHP